MYLQVRADLEGKLNRKFDTFAAILVASQVVAGINYFVKVGLVDRYGFLRMHEYRYVCIMMFEMSPLNATCANLMLC